MDLLNALHELSARGDEARMRAILAELTEYTVHHFAYEERLMEEVGYPGLDAHRESHRALVARVEDLNARFQAGRAQLTGELFAFLRSWLNAPMAPTAARRGPRGSSAGAPASRTAW